MRELLAHEKKYKAPSRRHSESQWNGVWGSDVAICRDGFVFYNDEIATIFYQHTTPLKNLAMTEARGCGLSNDIHDMFTDEEKYKAPSRRHSESQWNGVRGSDVAICRGRFAFHSDEIATIFYQRTIPLKNLAMTVARRCGF